MEITFTTSDISDKRRKWKVDLRLTRWKENQFLLMCGVFTFKSLPTVSCFSDVWLFSQLDIHHHSTSHPSNKPFQSFFFSSLLWLLFSFLNSFAVSRLTVEQMLIIIRLGLFSFLICFKWNVYKWFTQVISVVTDVGASFTIFLRFVFKFKA